MNANDYAFGFSGSNPDGITDDLAGHLLGDEGKAELERLDDHWREVMKLAERYGFIIDSFGGVATLCVHRECVNQCGVENEAKRLRAQRVELGGGE